MRSIPSEFRTVKRCKQDSLLHHHSSVDWMAWLNGHCQLYGLTCHLILVPNLSNILLILSHFHWRYCFRCRLIIHAGNQYCLCNNIVAKRAITQTISPLSGQQTNKIVAKQAKTQAIFPIRRRYYLYRPLIFVGIFTLNGDIVFVIAHLVTIL